MTTTLTPATSTAAPDTFVRRHIGPSPADVAEMLRELGYASLDDFIAATVPESIRVKRPLGIGPARTEHDVLREIRGMAGKNRVFRSYLGLGYHDTLTPLVILRNILEPGLVHGVHAVPVGDRAGAPRGAAELPDDGD